jgi:glycine cleavage system H lipoate-binding protein
LNFEPSLNVDLKEVNGYLDAGELKPLEDNRAVSVVKCPLDGTIYNKATSSGKIC